MFEFLSATLLVKRSYYESICKKGDYFESFYKSKINQKDNLWNSNWGLAYNIISIGQKMERIK